MVETKQHPNSRALALFPFLKHSDKLTFSHRHTVVIILHCFTHTLSPLHINPPESVWTLLKFHILTLLHSQTLTLSESETELLSNFCTLTNSHSHTLSPDDPYHPSNIGAIMLLRWRFYICEVTHHKQSFFLYFLKLKNSLQSSIIE